MYLLRDLCTHIDCSSSGPQMILMSPEEETDTDRIEAENTIYCSIFCPEFNFNFQSVFALWSTYATSDMKTGVSASRETFGV